MWHREYKDYPTDTTLKKQKVEPGRGIRGCEMHELNGWGNTIHVAEKKKNRNFIANFIINLFGKGGSP